jgi:hypothetical protein
MRTRKLLTAAAVAASLLAMTGTASASPGALARARAATDRFHNVEVATNEGGYSLLTDKDGIACIDNPPLGGMGIHYVNGSLVDDPSEHPSRPELLVYEPLKNGRLRLVALEYVVIQSAWEAAGNVKPPTLFGEEFELVAEGNRYGLPPFYELHAWVWKHNPRGLFDDWNPRVQCP